MLQKAHSHTNKNSANKNIFTLNIRERIVYVSEKNKEEKEKKIKQGHISQPFYRFNTFYHCTIFVNFRFIGVVHNFCYNNSYVGDISFESTCEK